MKISYNCLLSAAVLLLTVTSALGQEQTSEKKFQFAPQVGVNTGVLIYKGDLAKGFQPFSLSRIKYGYGLNIDQKVSSLFSVGVNGLSGKLEYNEKGGAFRNFQTKFIQGSLNAYLFTDNGKILPTDVSAAPYLGVGVGYSSFNTAQDLVAANGNRYYYWSDGSVRDMAQSDTAFFKSNILRRDYTYENKVLSGGTVIVPLTFGIRFNIAPPVDFRLATTYNYSLTDELDNLKEGSSDGYLYSSFALTWRFGTGRKEDPRYENVDFATIEHSDKDGDGVLDLSDECPGTPKDVKVDGRGCPRDGDQDGVPDYVDQEPNSPKGAIVNTEGRVISDEEFAKEQAKLDSLATERAELFYQNPSMKGLQALDEKIKQSSGNRTMPAKLARFDLNGDGLIQSEEITKAVEAFFTGEGDYPSERINELIDYFFEQ